MTREWVTVLGLILITVSILLFVAAALHDFAARTVPNGLALALALTGLAARAIDRRSYDAPIATPPPPGPPNVRPCACG